FQGKGMTPASCNGGDRCETTHLHGNIDVGIGPIAELTKEVESPSPHGAIRLQGKGMSISCCNGGDPGNACLDGNKARSVGPIPELTSVIVSPGPDRAVILQGNGIRGSSSFNGLDARERAYLRGNIAVRVVPIPKLTPVVESPSPDGAVTLQGK